MMMMYRSVVPGIAAGSRTSACEGTGPWAVLVLCAEGEGVGHPLHCRTAYAENGGMVSNDAVRLRRELKAWGAPRSRSWVVSHSAGPL